MVLHNSTAPFTGQTMLQCSVTIRIMHVLLCVITHCGSTPYLEDGGDRGVWLEQEELSPLLPTDLNVAIFVHPTQK